MFSEYRDYKQFLIYIYDPLIFDLMTLKSTQFIGSARFPELNSNPICQFLMRMRPQAIFAYIMSPWPLIIWTIHWLCKIHKWSKFGRNPSICSNDNTITSYFCIHNEPHDLDLYLMTPKSNQFISSASNIHDLSLAGIHQSGSWDKAITSCFCIHNVRCDLWPQVTPKSNQFIGFARYIHDQSLAGIHQSVLQITRSQAVFAYIMSPVTFDPRDPQNLISSSALQDTYMTKVWQESINRLFR